MNKISYGVKQLIMINSGTVEYLKLNLNLPLHLNAENNIGKTSTVNTLQFLYIDSMKDMALPTSETDSTNFYFRDEYSYLIFECVSQTGTYCVILNRPPETRSHFNRFVIHTAFDESIFIENCSPLNWAGVLTNLSEQNIEYNKVKNSDWWRVLSGLTEKNKKQNLPALFILPVRDTESYARFKMIYRHLLSMSNIKLETFKDILLACAVASGEKRKIDFAERNYKDDFNKCRRLQQQQDYYRANESEIIELQKRDKSVKEFQIGLPAAFAELKWNYDFHLKNLENQIPIIKTRLIKIENEQKEKNKQRDDIIRKEVSLEADYKNINIKISEFNKLEQNQDLFIIRERFQSFKEFENHKEEIEEKYIILKNKLKGIRNFDKQNLENRIIRTKKEMKNYQHIVDNENLLFNWILNQGFSKNELNILATLFEMNILTTEMSEIKIKDKDELIKRLRYLVNNVDKNKFIDNIISIPLKTQVFSELTNREAAQERLKFLKVELKEVDEKLNLYLNEEENINNFNLLETQRLHFKEMIKLYESFDYLKIKMPELKQKENNIKVKVDELRNKKIELELQKVELDEEVSELRDSLSKKEGALSELIGNFNRLNDNIQQHFPNILNIENKSNYEELPLNYILEELLNCNSKVESLAADLIEVRMRKSQILKNVGSFFDGEKDWLKFIEENENIISAGERVDKMWQLFFGIAKHDFRILVQCVDSIDLLLRSINKSFSQKQISNLAQIKVCIDKNEIYEKYREFTIDSDDLFVDTGKRKLYMSWWEKEIDKYTDLRAEDMFHIKIEIANPNNLSENKNITSFDNESEGTNYTIKALLLSQLLQEQFKFGIGKENIVFHYYLDEIGQLDEDNLSNIISQNIERNLIPITAAPRPVFEPLCHPECRLVTLREHKETKLTYIDDDRTFSAKTNE